MRKDYRRLKEEADIRRVVEYVGIPVTKRGSAFFIHCIFPEHHDKHATNAYFKEGWNNVYCTVCNKSASALDILMICLNIGFHEAVDILFEIEGKPAWFLSEDRPQKREFRLSREESEAIGLHLPNYIDMVECVDEEKKTVLKLNESYASRSLEYLKIKSVRVDNSDFVSEQEFKRMVYRKSCEQLEILKGKKRNYIRFQAFLKCRNISFSLSELGYSQKSEEICVKLIKLLEKKYSSE